jgi:type IV pilus assembly protein PilV
VRNRIISGPRGQSGFTLVEAMSSVLIMSVGLLGVAALQSNSLSGSVNAAARSQAVVAVGDIGARMRANPIDYAAVTAADHACRAVHFGHRHVARECSAEQLAADDLADWQAMVAQTLPKGAGTVRRQGDYYRVEISWDERGGEGTAATRQRVTTVLRP